MTIKATNPQLSTNKCSNTGLNDVFYSDFQETYPDFVKSRTKLFDDNVLNLLHAVVGICGESGEILELIKKHWVYGKPLNRNDLYEEVGDLCFYLQMLLNHAELDFETILEHNMYKLSKRYHQGYSDKEAIDRKDEVNGTKKIQE